MRNAVWCGLTALGGAWFFAGSARFPVALDDSMLQGRTAIAAGFMTLLLTLTSPRRWRRDDARAPVASFVVVARFVVLVCAWIAGLFGAAAVAVGAESPIRGALGLHGTGTKVIASATGLEESRDAAIEVVLRIPSHVVGGYVSEVWLREPVIGVRVRRRLGAIRFDATKVEFRPEPSSRRTIVVLGDERGRLRPVVAEGIFQ